MKHIIILLFVLCTLNAAIAQKSKITPVITRYYQLTGTIDKYPATFNLHREGTRFYGNYYYQSTEEALELYGELNSTGSLRLVVNDRASGDMTEEFTGNFKDSSFSGTWTYKGKALRFSVSQPRNTSGLRFDYITTSGSKKLPKSEDISRSAITYAGAAVCPTASSTHPAIKLIKEKIFDAFGYTPTGTIGEAMLAEKNSVLKPKPDGEMDTYGVNTLVKIEYWNKQLLVLSKYNWTDGGGAHGNYGISYSNIDLVNNKELGLGSVLNNCDQLPALLEKKFRAVYHVKKDEKLNEYLLVDTIPVNNNFSLTTKGITFNYDPYEIGAYAMGQIRLYIPFKEIEACLTPEFKKLTVTTN